MIAMDMKEFEALVKEGESDSIEFKKSTGQLTRAAESLCGMLNRSGGRVLIGVTADGHILGQMVSDKTLRDIADILGDFEPPAPISLTRMQVTSGRDVLMLTAENSQESLPFTFRGRPYERVGTTTRLMPQERYQALLLERAHSKRRWENEEATDYQLEDLDREEILRTVRLGIDSGRLPESTGGDLGDILERLGLSRKGQLLNAAVVLFGNRMAPDYPQCQIRMARFRGVDKSEFLDQRQLDGHTFRLLDEALLFLKRHLPVAGRIQPGIFEREDEPLLPLAALREAMVNAFCHRDYSRSGGAVSLAIYDDRLEVWSEGTLPFGLRPEDLKKDHPSRPRNPLIAEVFYRRGLIERWGRGTQKVVELCVRAGHPEPDFGEQAGAVWVRFFPTGYVAPHRVVHDLTDRQREILHLLSTKQPMPLRDILIRLKNPPASATLRDDLYSLKRLELIELRGRGRGAVWVLKKKTS